MAMPFENYVQVYDLKGEHLLEALEFSVGTFQSDPENFNSGRMLQIGGNYTISIPYFLDDRSTSPPKSFSLQVIFF